MLQETNCMTLGATQAPRNSPLLTGLKFFPLIWGRDNLVKSSFGTFVFLFSDPLSPLPTYHLHTLESSQGQETCKDSSTAGMFI